MGTCDISSVREEAEVRKEAIAAGKTIHGANLLAICSEKNVELDGSCRSLKGHACYRGDSAKSADRKAVFYQALSASPASIVAANTVITYGLIKGHKVSTTDAVKAYLQAVLKSIAETWVRLPREVWPPEWLNEDGSPRSGYAGACMAILRPDLTGNGTWRSGSLNLEQ